MDESQVQGRIESVLGWKKPGAQGVQGVWPLEENDPAAQLPATARLGAAASRPATRSAKLETELRMVKATMMCSA